MDHEGRVKTYYKEFDEIYQSWDSEHYHLGFFDTYTVSEYKQNIDLVREERGASIRKMIHKVIEPADIKQDELVADCGCGVGGTAFYLNKMYGCRVVGLNISTSQLDTFNGEIKKRGLGNQVESKWCDCSQTLPLESESIDVVVNIESACHYSNRNQFLSEAYRVLKPGGRMVVQDWMYDESLSPEQYSQVIQPLCDAWYFVDIESHKTYMEKLSKYGLNVAQYHKYLDEIIPNAILFEEKRNHQYFLEVMDPEFESNPKMLEQLDTFIRAIYGGHLLINIYAAVKRRSKE